MMSHGRKMGLRGFISGEVMKEGCGRGWFAWNQKGGCAFGIIERNERANCEI
jgi:hypothetical protein